jgi:hypothetical protein
VATNKQLKKLYAAYLDLFSSPNGQVILEDMKLGFNDRVSHVKQDPYTTAFNEGQRSVYLHILGNIQLGNLLEKNNGRSTGIRSDAESADPDARTYSDDGSGMASRGDED